MSKHSIGPFDQKKGTTVYLKKNDIDAGIRGLRKIVNQEGIIRDMKKLEYYEKPKWKKKRKSMEARKRLRRRLAQMGEL